MEITNLFLLLALLIFLVMNAIVVYTLLKATKQNN